MKKIDLLFFPMSLLALGSLKAQSPGGVTPVAWYKADVGVYSDAGTTAATDNISVQQWNDQMGTGYNLMQATAAQKPTFSNQTKLANFNPTVTFISAGHGTGQGGFMAVDPGNGNAIINRTQGSIYIAGKMNTLGAAGLAGFDATMDFPGLHTNNTAPYDKLLFYSNTGNSNYGTLSSNSFANQNPFVAGSSWVNGAGTPNTNALAKVWLNGSETVYNNRINVAGTENTARIFRIGRDSNWGSHDGQLNEAIVFSNPLSASEKARVDSYLAVKWGSTLTGDYVNSDNTVVWSTSAIYQHNIFGVARDINGALYQKQSRSENPNQQLIIGAGSSLANTNTTNTNPLTDGQFLLVGDNGLEKKLKVALSYTAGSNGVINHRFESIWKVQNTNNVGQVTVAWPKGINNLYLVQSTDESFDGTDTFTPMTTEVTVNGVVYNTATVTLANGQYFTFAGYAHAPGGVINALSYWYRADKNAANSGAGTDVTSWTDFFSGAVSSQLGTNALPKYVEGNTDYFNFNPGINFTAGTQTLGNTNVRTFSADSYDIFTFTKEGMTPGGNFPSIFRSLVDNAFLTGGNRRWDGLGIQMNNIVERLSNTGGNTDTGLAALNGTFSATIPSVMYHTFTANTTTRGLNGAANFTTTTHGGTGVRNLNGGHLFGDSQFGGNGSDNRGFIGHLGETIIYGAGNLTAQERRRVDSYMAIKYGITLDRVATDHYLGSNAGIVWNGIDNSAYNHNIFGITHDEVSALHQKQSKSVNANQKLIIGAGNSLANTNAANTNSLTNGQYLIVGDNNLAQSLTTPLTRTGGSNGDVNLRFASIWKVQNTGSVGQVTVAWPKGISNLYLVQSATDTFDATSTFTPMTTEVNINGVFYNTATVNLTDGQYFTFAGFVHSPAGVSSGIARWYRSDRGVTLDADRVSTLVDQVSNSETITQATATRRPVYNSTSNFINFNPNMVFTPNPHTALNSMTGGFAPGTTGLTSFSVAVPTASTMAQRKYIFGMSNASQSADNVATNTTMMAVGNTLCANSATPNIGKWRNCAEYAATGSWVAGMPSIITAGSRPAPNNISFFAAQNGNAAATGNGAVAMNYTETGFGLGSAGDNYNDTSVYGWSGQISEVILYGGELSETDQRRVDSYLAIKHGITLGRVATNHYLGSTASPTSIVWNGADNTAYNKNIFGIARSDIGDFEQKVSKSINTGTIITVATDDDYISGNTHASRTSLTTDETYSLIGDNEVTGTTNIAPNEYRTNRVWRVQTTGSDVNPWVQADLSDYRFHSNVEMWIADDENFTTNLVKIPANSYNASNVATFNPTFTQGVRYFTFSGFIPNYCFSGDCNPNAYVQSSDPNTIDYDQMVSTFHSTIVKENDGTFKIWGEDAASNGTGHLYSPTNIAPPMFNYTGTPLRATGASGIVGGENNHQYALLTTDGLYVWGQLNGLVSSTIKNTTAFGKISVGGKTDGLPAGVNPTDVKMMFGSYGTLAITTCSGEAWVLSFFGNKNGDGTVENTTNNAIWHRVKTSAATDLTNVVAMRGSFYALFALTADGKLYTWGTGTLINDGNSATNRTYATEVSVPAGVTPKMIGMTQAASTTQTYYLLATDGRLFAMGYNANKQLGDGTTATRTNWVQPQKITNQHGQGTGSLENIAWISPGEHSSYGLAVGAINVLTNDHKQWAWGSNNFSMIGGSGTMIDPTYMPGNSTAANGLSLTDEIIAVETAGHTTINIKKGSEKFGYVGHYVNGSAGNGTNIDSSVSTYTYNTGVVMVCAADVDPDANVGYIYITKKALDENSSVDFNFTVNGGPVTAFTLNDRETKVDLSDLGSSESGRLWAVASNGTLYYRNAGSSDWVQTTVTTATKVDGAAGSDCYFTNAAGQVLKYDGVTTPTLIGSPANYGTLNATDVGSAWNTTPYIMTSNNTIWIYSGSGTAWTQVGTTTNNLKGVDADPSTGDAIVTDGTIVYRLTSAGVKTSLGAPPGWVDDIAVTSAGEVFSAAQTGHVRKWVSGTTWSDAEETSRILAGRITAGHKEQVWSTNPVYSSLQSIYTRMVAGTTVTWLDDERVRTTSKGNTIMIKVPVGTYTIKETATTGWELQSMDIYDPTLNSSSNFADQSVTLNVAEGETVHAVFTNGLVNTFAMGNDCSVVFFEDFGSDAAGTVGPPLAGQTSYHYADGSDFAQDGYYKVAANAGQFWGGADAGPYDHTSGDGTGRMMTINASYEKGIFFRRKFTNLVPGKSYKFSAWLMSLSDDTIKPNATFQVIDPTSGTVLNTVSSGDIMTHNVWNEYSMDFVPTSTELDLVLLNNALGGNGNDIALDDIRFEMNPPQNLVVSRNCSAGTVSITSPVGAVYEYSLDNINWQASPLFTGVTNTVTNYYVRYADAIACVSSAPLPSCFCYKPGATSGGTIFDTNVGITALGRAGATDADNWPMLRKGGWIALESKTKAFVPNRLAFDASGNPVGIVPANFVEGMMVYDTTNNCMKVYTLKEGATTMAWHCMTTQTCPE